MIRYTLEYIGVPYDETRYRFDEFQDWIGRDKPALEGTLALPNLPHLKDGDVHFTEHDAILRYLAKKYKLDLQGKNDKDYALQENFLCFVSKLWMKQIAEFCYSEDPTEENRIAFLESIKVHLTRLDKQLEKTQYFVGDYLTLADIYFYEVLESLLLIKEDCLTPYSSIQRFKKDFDAQEWFQKYLASGQFIKGPYFGPSATINRFE